MATSTTAPCLRSLRCSARYSIEQAHQTQRYFSRSPRLSSDVATASKAELDSSYKYCVDLVRKYDSPSYVLSTFIPRHVIHFYIALRALNVSLSMIPDTTSTPTIGLMRLQFWRDTITRTLQGTPPKEPIALLLASALSDLDTRAHGRAKISKGWFLRMINAREQHLTNTPYTTLESLETYAENTYSTLLYLTLSAMPMTSLTADHVASHIGKAAGITAVLRGLPLIAFPPSPKHHSNQDSLSGIPGSGVKQGTVMLPLDVMAQAGVKEEDVFRQGADAPGLRDAVFTVATRASDHLITARQMVKNLRAGQDVGHDFEHEGEEGHEYDDAAAAHEHVEAGESSASGGGGEKLSNLTMQLQEVERAFGVLMPAVPTSIWLDRLQKVDFDVFKPELRTSDWKLPWKAYWAFQRQTF
ncbi:hypothetical protein AJ80_06936 [Polytolypa hystricis UAMH7299]|uniref:Squalene/phytoene synthase n=1 Tax=Polytolypa hystricis (strain UAMH7299) TaxID=1447883 RepID=A0A2B7XSX6_POLH7|nr:hypothetical protein AJ80_06936 [Polytolypa hystricis UAMH7299]